MPEHRFPVEAGHILLFARAMGDPNPIYADADYAQTTEVGGIIAPPTFERASVQFDPSYHLRPKSGEPWFGSGREPSGGPHPQAPEGGTAMHAEQHYEYHRPLRPTSSPSRPDRASAGSARAAAPARSPSPRRSMTTMTCTATW